MEAKGTPSAGTPSPSDSSASSGSVGAPAGNASTTGATGSTSGGQILNGCLSGDVNSYAFKANGNNYRLQGNTSMLKGMSGHQVEITGDVFNGKAIQVNGARDLGSSCSGK
jgi:hypothetical protein